MEAISIQKCLVVTRLTLILTNLFIGTWFQHFPSFIPLLLHVLPFLRKTSIRHATNDVNHRSTAQPSITKFCKQNQSNRKLKGQILKIQMALNKQSAAVFTLKKIFPIPDLTNFFTSLHFALNFVNSDLL